MDINTTKGILKEFSDRHCLPDEITTIFYDSNTGEEIGFSFDHEDEPFIYVDVCDDMNVISKTVPEAIKWTGWDRGIIGTYGSHIVYNVEKAEETYAEENNIELSEAIEHWEFNVEGTLPYVDSATRPYHMIEIYE